VILRSTSPTMFRYMLHSAQSLLTFIYVYIHPNTVPTIQSLGNITFITLYFFLWEYVFQLYLPYNYETYFPPNMFVCKWTYTTSHAVRYSVWLVNVRTSDASVIASLTYVIPIPGYSKSFSMFRFVFYKTVNIQPSAVVHNYHYAVIRFK